MARKGWSQGQYRGAYHGSTRTGLRHEIERGWGLPHQTDQGFRLCKDAPETVQHIAPRCKMQGGMVYLTHQNQVAGLVYRNICAGYALKVQKWIKDPS